MEKNMKNEKWFYKAQKAATDKLRTILPLGSSCVWQTVNRDRVIECWTGLQEDGKSKSMMIVIFKRGSLVSYLIWETTLIASS